MIIDFTVKNFKSIKETQTLSLSASGLKRDDHLQHLVNSPKEPNIQVLKSAVIYGANASGKTNVIEALKIFREFVLRSSDQKVGEEIQFYRPFKLDRECLDAPMEFELEFIAQDSVRYRYAVSVNRKEVLREELVSFPQKQESRLFLREKGKAVRFGTHLKGRKKSIEAELLNNQLFLSRAANSNHEQLREIYLYFLKKLVCYLVQGIPSGMSPNPFSREIQKEEKDLYRERLKKFLAAADTGIHDLWVERQNFKDEGLHFAKNVPEEIKRDIIESFSYRLGTYHKGFTGDKESENVRFELEEESHGTQKMFYLAAPVIRVLQEGGCLIVDELDGSMHPLMSRFIVELFHDPQKNPHHAQLIFTTHDTSLLNPELFRRDQIWFTAKDRRGATELFALDEFNKNEVRKNTPYEKWYLDGRFGALPFIDKNLFNPTDADC